ncbi:MAG: phospho-N-acetylmuramoyl-pentapeptide-transferase [Cyanothece sp. SIO1E1]|nr:phospho-N-acetylmuramoyl-pentapeptide-transferase [Cyanothece sp. SIO1E1]
MDAKLFSDKSLSFSGASLLWSLTISLCLAVIYFDLFLVDDTLGLVPTLTLPFLACVVIVAILGHWCVPLLRMLKTGQFIREDGPRAHLRKAGTPTMGGIFFIPVAVIIALLWSNFSLDVVAVSGLTLAYGLIGLLDDWQVLRRRSNKGISPKAKLMLQIAFGLAFCFWLFISQPVEITNLALPFGLTLPLGILFWPLAGFVLVAESNSTNLTDGLDGLAAGTVAIALMGLGILIAPNSFDLTIFCVCMSGSCLGFLFHNRNPARVFMGDTGSLSLGGALAAVALLSNSLFGLLILSLIFLMETLSVIAQVSYYKATKGPDGIGKRLFKMAPFHHHLELTGWSEIQIVAAAYAVGGILSLLSFNLNLF